MSNSVIDELVAKTLQELNEPEKPTPRSRISTTSNGYIHLIAWANASLVRILVHKFTDPLPKSEYRLKHQIDDAARSVVANIEEGFARPTTSEYLTFLGYSEASLIEVKGDIQRSLQDNLLKSIRNSTLITIGINLQDWHSALKKSVISHDPSQSSQNPLNPSKGIYRNLQDSKGMDQVPSDSFKFLYPPVDDIKSKDLSYEIIIELINKTSWHLRRLVVSLEDKLEKDQKFYYVEKARVRSNLKFKR